MSNSYSPRPDSRIFASYPMPAKIDLLNERPRRESLVEQQLENQISRNNLSGMGSECAPRIVVTEQTSTIVTREESCLTKGNDRQQMGHPKQVGSSTQGDAVSIGRTVDAQQANQNLWQQQQQQQQQKQQQQQQRQQQNWYASPSQVSQPQQTQQRYQQNQITTTSNTINKTNAAALLAAELAEKEEQLKQEISILHERPYSPFRIPAKIDLTTEQRIAQQQYQNAPSPRPQSRASSTRSASADFLEKEAKLLQEIEEIESKPYNPQTMIIEREQWYAYPEGRPTSKQMTDSRRRVRDFCSMPPGLGQDQHVHEDGLRHGSGLGVSPTPGSIHTTIIRSPKREIDNKSPLPFAFDNFSTKGVRGNIASVGAVEPDRPRPPIYPIVKRTPSPSFARQ